MPGIKIDFEFQGIHDPPDVFITWEGYPAIKFFEEPIYLGGEWEDPSSWEPGPMAKLIYKLAISAMRNFDLVVEAKPIRGIPHDNIPIPESVRIRLEGDYLPNELPPVRYELNSL